MGLETSSTIEEVKNRDGATAAPASDEVNEFDHVSGSAVDLNADPVDVDLSVPPRAGQVVIHVDPSAAAAAAVQFNDSDGNTVTSRDSNDNSGFSSDGSTDIFVVVEVASPFVSVTLSNTSGGSNLTDYNIYVR